MNHPPTYIILGSGRQGTAAGYDMARWGEAGTVVCADAHAEVAQAAAERINGLVGRPVARPVQIDVQDQAALVDLLRGADACLSAVPYRFNLAVTTAAVEAGVHLCDLGGHTGIARQQHAVHDQARAAGLSIIPNCGQVPGMGTTLMVWAMEMLDETTDVYMWDCGLPQKPRLPFNYMMTFHIAGLTNEYAEPGIFLRDGKVTEVESMTEMELVEFPEPIGILEGIVTGGGLDTMPWTYLGKLRTLQNLTLRYPGTSAQLKAYKDLGLWDLEPVEVNGQTVIPREVFHTLFAPKVTFPEDKDLIIIRIRAVGMKDGRPAEAWVDLIDYYDEETGFTAMERGTGFSAAIVAEMMVRGETPRGAGGVEIMVPTEPFVAELRKRNFKIEHRVEIK